MIIPDQVGMITVMAWRLPAVSAFFRCVFGVVDGRAFGFDFIVEVLFDHFGLAVHAFEGNEASQVCRRQPEEAWFVPRPVFGFVAAGLAVDIGADRVWVVPILLESLPVGNWFRLLRLDRFVDDTESRVDLLPNRSPCFGRE